MSVEAIVGIVVVVALAAVILWLMFTYNRFVAKQNKIDLVWDEVDEHLKLRRELIPNLLGTAAGHMGASEKIFKRIEEISAAVTDDMEDKDSAPLENELSGLLRQLRSDASKQQELMLDQKFITTLGELVSMEGRAAAACERHNALVREYNSQIKAFPANVVVTFLHFDPCEMRIFGS